MDTKVEQIQSFVRDPAAGSTVNVLGVTHVYKATAAETGGILLPLGGRDPTGWRRAAAHSHPRG